MKYHQITKKKQQGMVLIVALIMLLLVTILGVAAVNRSGISSQIAGNSMFSMLVYQGAESAIAKSAAGGAEMIIDEAAKASPNSYEVPTSHLPAEEVSAGRKMRSKALVTAVAGGPFPCPIISDNASSTSIKCYVYEVDANSRLLSTGARARHVEARSKKIP